MSTQTRKKYQYNYNAYVAPLSARPAHDMFSPDCIESSILITVRLNYQTRCSMEYFTLQYLHIGIHTAQYMFVILCKIHPVLRLTSRLNNHILYIMYLVNENQYTVYQSKFAVASFIFLHVQSKYIHMYSARFIWWQEE